MLGDLAMSSFKKLRGIKHISIGLALLASLSACKTLPSNTDTKEAPGNRVQRSKELQSPQNFQEWDKVIEQLSKGPLSESEADFAYLLAENFISQKQLEPATKLMRSVFNSQPSLVAGIQLVRLITLTGDLIEAEQVARKLQLFYNKSPEPSLAIAYIAQLKGNKEEALEILDTTTRKHPKNEEVSARYISLLIDAGKKAKAQEVLLKAISAMPQSPYFLLKLARLKTDEKNFKEAKNLLDKLLKNAPDNIEGWTLAGFIAIQEKNDTAAEKFFREAYEKQPENDSLARYYVTQLLKLQKYQEARRLLLRLEAASDVEEPMDPDLTFQLGYVFFQMEEFTEAKKRFLNLVEKTDDKDRMFFYTAQCEERLKNNAEALIYYSKISTTDELYTAALQRIIYLTIDDGKFEQAESIIEAFIRKTKDKMTEDEVKFIASSYARMGKFNKAQNYANIGLQKFPGSVDLQYLKAAYLEHTESKVSSIEALEKLVSRSPDHVQSLNHLGYTLGDANQKLEFALTLVQRALQKEPKNGFYLDSLGWIQFKLKQYTESEKSLNAAHKLEPNEPIILEHLGELKLATGQLPAALRFFESAALLFEKQPKWKIESDAEWSASKVRVESRIQEIRKKALPTSER